MKKTIKIFLLLCIFCFLTGFSSNNISNQKDINFKEEFVDFDNLEFEDTLSYDEMVSVIEKTRTEEEIKIFKESNKQSDVFYKSTNKAAKKGEYRYVSWGGKISTYKISGKTYKLRAKMDVKLYYETPKSKPRIEGLSGYHVYTGGGEKCVFNGRMNVHLTSGRSFYYSYYGDLYKTGKTTWNFGGAISIGGFANATATVTYSDSYLKNISVSENFYNELFRP